MRTILCLLLAGINLFAQITLDTKTVKVLAFTDGNAAATVTAQVNVKAESKIEGLIVVAKPFKALEGNIVGDPSNVKLVATAPVNIESGPTVPLIISIAALPGRGNYQGSLTLRTAKPGVSEEVDLEIDLQTKPNVTLGTDGLSAYSSMLHSFIQAAERWAPARKTVAIYYQGGGRVTLEPPQVFLRGVRRGAVLDNARLKPSIPARLEGAGGVKAKGQNAITDIKLDEVTVPFGWGIQFFLATEIGGATNERTVEAVKGTAGTENSKVELPKFTVARIRPKAHAFIEVWRMTLDATLTRRYLFAREYYSFESADPKRVYRGDFKGWASYIEPTLSIHLDQSGHISLSGTWKDSIVPPSYVRANTVQSGLEFKF